MHPANEPAYYDFDEFRIDIGGQQLLKNGKPLTLTNKAFLILLTLVRNSGQIVEKEEIILQVWGEASVEEANLSQYIYVLRKVLGNDPGGNPYIETITRRGFRFTARVAVVSSKAEGKQEVFDSDFGNEILKSLDSKAGEDDIAGTQSEEKPKFEEETSEIEAAENLQKERSPGQKLSRKNSQTRIRFLLIAVSVFILIILIAGYVYKNHQTSNSPVGSKTKSIAVLPFKTIGEESSDEKLGLGMADAIITRLNKLKRIQVRSTGTVSNFTDQSPVNTWQIGKDLGVDAILEGTVQKDDGRVRVSVQLTNIADGKSIWAESYDEAFTDIFTLQDSVSAKVVNSIELNLLRDQ